VTLEETKKRDAARRIRDIYTFALDKFHEDNEENEYAMTHKYVVDGEFYGGPTRFINHSCEPNVRQFCVSIHHHDDPSLYDLAFYATKPIPAGTEFTFDYTNRSGHQGVRRRAKREPGVKMSKCRCGSRKCRGYLWL
jgi:histone-lysine N-methyltransferase SUV39H